MSRDATGVDNRAAEVRGAIAGVTTNLAQLQTVLVKVVRTSTDDADRRRSPRVKCDLPAQIVVGVRKIKANLHDISEGGARLKCEPDMQVGDKGSIVIQGLRQTLSFSVRNREIDALHVEFDGSEVFAEWFRHTFASMAAA